MSRAIALTSVGFFVGDSVGFLDGDSVGFFVGDCKQETSYEEMRVERGICRLQMEVTCKIVLTSVGFVVGDSVGLVVGLLGVVPVLQVSKDTIARRGARRGEQTHICRGRRFGRVVRRGFGRVARRGNSRAGRGDLISVAHHVKP